MRTATGMTAAGLTAINNSPSGAAAGRCHARSADNDAAGTVTGDAPWR